VSAVGVSGVKVTLPFDKLVVAPSPLGLRFSFSFGGEEVFNLETPVPREGEHLVLDQISGTLEGTLSGS
jgi:hypothetical protein